MTHPQPNPTRLFFAGMLIFALTGIIPIGFGLAVPVFAQTFGLTEADAGTIMTAHGAGAVLSVLASILGLRGLTARLSLTVFGLGLIAIWLGPTWPAKLLATFVMGTGHGLVAVVFNRRFLHEFGDKGPGMVGLINASYAAGAILGPFVILGLGGNVALVFGLAGFLALGMVAVVQPAVQRSVVPPLAGLVTRRWAILAFATLAAAIEVGTTGFGPAALIAQGWTNTQAASLLSGFFVAFLIGRASLYWLVKVLTSPTLFLLGMSGAALSLGYAALVGPATGFVVAGCFIGIGFPALFVWVSGLLGDDNRVSAAILGASLAGAALSPLILRPTLLEFGVGSAFAVLAVLALAASVLTAFIQIIGVLPKTPVK